MDRDAKMLAARDYAAALTRRLRRLDPSNPQRVADAVARTIELAGSSPCRTEDEVRAWSWVVSYKRWCSAVKDDTRTARTLARLGGCADTDLPTEEQVERRILAAQAADEADRLPGVYPKVLRLLMDGYSVAESAALLGMDTVAVQNARTRALTRLRQRFGVTLSGVLAGLLAGWRRARVPVAAAAVPVAAFLLAPAVRVPLPWTGSAPSVAYAPPGTVGRDDSGQDAVAGRGGAPARRAARAPAGAPAAAARAEPTARPLWLDGERRDDAERRDVEVRAGGSRLRVTNSQQSPHSQQSSGPVSDLTYCLPRPDRLLPCVS